MKIKLFVGKTLLGEIQSISFIESPHYHDDIYGQKLIANNIIINKDKTLDAFTQNLPHVGAQQYPFQIIIEQDDKQFIKIHNVWSKSFDSVYIANKFYIITNAELEAESISSALIISSDK